MRQQLHVRAAVAVPSLAALIGLLTPALSLAQNTPLRFTGEVRVRSEAEQAATADTIDAFTLLRTRFGVEAALSQRALVYVQVQDARTFGEEASTVAGSAPRFDMHQAWLQYRLDAGDYALSLRAGRQEISFGNERLVGAAGWTNTGRAFDGLRATLGSQSSGWRLHALAATVAERGRRLNGVAPRSGDHVLAGGYLETGKVELFGLHDREASYRSATGVDRTTLGGRIQTPAVHGFTASVEGAYQVGNQLWSQQPSLPVTQNLEAYMVGGSIGYGAPGSILTQVSAGADFLSGDDDPDDATYRAFNTLYATNHRHYGYLDLFLDPAARTRDRGLVDANLSVRLSLADQLALDLDAHAFRLARAFRTANEKSLGWELDFTLPVTLGTGQTVNLGYSFFRNGAAAPLIGLGNDGEVWHWAYIQASFSFGGSIAPIM